MVKIEFDLEDFKAKLIDALEDTGVATVEKLKLDAPVAGGHLQRNIGYNVEERGDQIILNFNFPEYAKYVEYGSGPRGDGTFTGTPALTESFIAEIEEWCRQKGIPLEMAGAIAKIISVEGTYMHPFIRPVMDTKFNDILLKNLKKSFK